MELEAIATADHTLASIEGRGEALSLRPAAGLFEESGWRYDEITDERPTALMVSANPGFIELVSGRLLEADSAQERRAQFPPWRRTRRGTREFREPR